MFNRSHRFRAEALLPELWRGELQYLRAGPLLPRGSVAQRIAQDGLSLRAIGSRQSFAPLCEHSLRFASESVGLLGDVLHFQLCVATQQLG